MTSLSEEEERKLIVSMRERFKRIDSLEGLERIWASLGIPESEWPAYTAWVTEAKGLIDGSLERRWDAKQRQWTTEKTR